MKAIIFTLLDLIIDFYVWVLNADNARVKQMCTLLFLLWEYVCENYGSSLENRNTFE